jgi:hypothetical protein
MGIAYFGVKLSDNWVETPEHYILFKNCVIGRTGFQKYKGSELDPKELEQQGVTIAPNEEVELYRSPDEVFSAATIASFQLKSVTDGHPDALLTLDSVKEHEQGQISNVREGKEALDSGDFPLLADLMVKSRVLIEKIKAGLRELSCGYNYHILKVGNKLCQVDIVGNHVAIVNAGRAGSEASIKDSLETSTEEKKGWTVASILDQILGKSSKTDKIRQWAKDAKAEDVATVVDALSSELEKKEEDKNEGKDAKHGKDCDCKDCKNASDAKDSKEANDKKAMDRKRYHDALDKMIDGKEEEMEASDADMEELKAMFTGGAKDGKDETVAGSQDGKEMPANGGIEGTRDSELEALIIEPADRTQSTGAGTDAAKALDEARIDGAKAVLKALRPLVANSSDKKLKGGFDTVVKTVIDATVAPGGTAGKGGYGAVATAASQVGKDAKASKAATTVPKEVEDAYSARKGQRN